MRSGSRLTSLFYLDHCFLIVPPYPAMVPLSSENPIQTGFSSRVSHAANEANAPLFSPFRRPLAPPLLPEATARSSRAQMHQHVRVPASIHPCSPRALCSAAASLADCAGPSSRCMAHSALSPARVLPKAASKSFQQGPSPVGKGLRQDSLFSYYANVGFQASRDGDRGKGELREPE